MAKAADCYIRYQWSALHWDWEVSKRQVIRELTVPLVTNIKRCYYCGLSASELKLQSTFVVDKGTVINHLTPPNTPPTPFNTLPTCLLHHQPGPTTPPHTCLLAPPTLPTTPSTDKPKEINPSGSQPKEDINITFLLPGETVSAGLKVAGLALQELEACSLPKP